MKIFTSQQIYEADKNTIANQRITSDELMERAATQLFNWLHLRLQGAPVKIHLFCGIGNNGGDGLVLARLLQEHGYLIHVHVVSYSERRSHDFLLNLDRLKERKIWPGFMGPKDALPQINKEDIVVDAIFGIGLNRTPEPWVIKIIQHLNSSGAFVLSVDVPSGLFVDKAPENKNSIVRANHVLSFQAPKLVFLLPETGIYSNQWEVLDIGLDKDYLDAVDNEYELIGKNEILPWYMPREKFSHKGTYGHSLIIGGSYGKIGAVILAADACLNTGSGLVTAFVPQCGYIPLQTALPEAMVITDTDHKVVSDIQFDVDPTVIGLGIGIGQDEITVGALKKFLKTNKTPLVIDADAINIISKHKDMLELIPDQSVLTPHPKELERLIGSWQDDFEKLEKAKDFSKQNDLILVIKGAHTITLFNGKGYINSTGNPGMATAGSGDVLTGMITGLIAQGYDSLRATVFAIYLHGRSGDLAVEQCGYQALTASEIIDFIGDAFLDLFNVHQASDSQDEME
ncbi:NAD(P)H-hydrate dehydratase [Sediminicola sp. 1XM1-17]|uniref:NAD(P)H-hydrate dehydratase n=1 Tax=Sediminicola sp. 1XM1-17 TaxID=3127702 RepID=UPI003077FFB1